MFRRLFVLLLAVSLPVAACSSSADSTAEDSSSTTAATTTTAPPATAATTTTRAPASTTTAPAETTTTTAAPTTTTTLPPEPEGFPVVHEGWQSFTNPNWVQGIVFDSDGMLWAAGLGGLVRWDPESGEYAEMRSEHGTPGNQLTAVTTTPDGAVWVGSSDAGIGRFDGERWTYFTTGEGLPSDTILAMAATSGGTVWAATQQGLVAGDAGGFAEVAIPQDLWATTADIVVTPDDVVWLGARSLTRIVDGDAETFGADVIVEETGVNDLFVAPDGSLYVLAVQAGMLHLVDGGFEQIPLPADAFFNPRLIGADESGVWYASGDVLTLIGDDGVEEFWADEQLPFGFEVTDIVAGPDGRLWFPGYAGGVSAFDGDRWVTLEIPTDIPENRVWSIAEATDGAIWAGFPDAVGRFDGTSWELWDMFCPCSLSPGPDGSMWLASIFEGVYEFDGTRWRPSLPADNGVVTVLATSDGEVWAANGWPPTVHRMADGGWQELPLPPLETGTGLGLLSEGPDGTIWLGSDNGHFSWTGGGWAGHPQVTDGFWAYDSGGLWFGPDGSKWFYNVSGFARVNGVEEFWSGFDRGEFGFGFAGGITADTSGAIWAATSDGIGSYDGTEWTVLDPLDGPSAWQVNDLAAASDGSVWFATHGGVCRFGSPLESDLVGEEAVSSDPADLAARAEIAANDAEVARDLALPACESMEEGFAVMDDPDADMSNFDFEAWDRDVVACFEAAERAVEAADAAATYAAQAESAAPGSAEAQSAAAAAERARSAADEADEARGDLELGP